MRTSLLSIIPTALVRSMVIFTLLLPLQADASGSSDDATEPTTAEQLKSIEQLIYKEKYSAAIKKLKKTIKGDKQSADAWNLLGFASRKSGDTDAADNAYKQALTINKDHLGALEYQGELFITLGRLDDAKSNLNHLETLCPEGCDEQAELADAIAAEN